MDGGGAGGDGGGDGRGGGSTGLGTEAAEASSAIASNITAATPPSATANRKPPTARVRDETPP